MASATGIPADPVSLFQGGVTSPKRESHTITDWATTFYKKDIRIYLRCANQSQGLSGRNAMLNYCQECFWLFFLSQVRLQYDFRFSPPEPVGLCLPASPWAANLCPNHCNTKESSGNDLTIEATQPELHHVGIVFEFPKIGERKESGYLAGEFNRRGFCQLSWSWRETNIHDALLYSIHTLPIPLISKTIRRSGKNLLARERRVHLSLTDFFERSLKFKDRRWDVTPDESLSFSRRRQSLLVSRRSPFLEVFRLHGMPKCKEILITSSKVAQVDSRIPTLADYRRFGAAKFWDAATDPTDSRSSSVQSGGEASPLRSMEPIPEETEAGQAESSQAVQAQKDLPSDARTDSHQPRSHSVASSLRSWFSPRHRQPSDGYTIINQQSSSAVNDPRLPNLTQLAAAEAARRSSAAPSFGISFQGVAATNESTSSSAAVPSGLRPHTQNTHDNVFRNAELADPSPAAERISANTGNAQSSTIPLGHPALQNRSPTTSGREEPHSYAMGDHISPTASVQPPRAPLRERLRRRWDYVRYAPFRWNVRRQGSRIVDVPGEVTDLPAGMSPVNDSNDPNNPFRDPSALDGSALGQADAAVADIPALTPQNVDGEAEDGWAPGSNNQVQEAC